ncbi:lytic murein transglycosylase [Phenylobacterium deserti]|uniref:Lytic murein transglycosylase n=2 Tax=Phenylobacterium deserti TaxID=1914756 RepID=A0A328AVK5_9CAUL|nr:lytic murein transglycosylase [Phenylobacterium deserti]
MRRSHLVLMLALAGCASQAPHTPQPQPAPAPPPAAQPAPPPPVAGPVRPPAVSGDQIFDAWAAEFYGRAVQAGIRRSTLDRELAGLTPDPRVASLDTRQPEFSKPLSSYVQGAVTSGRIAIGQRKRVEVPRLDAIEAQYGVPRDVLLGIWAMETGFGAIMGDFDVIRSMATLAAQGRRRQFAEDQLIAALKMIETGEVTRRQLRGSWAGAFGQTQFIPTTFLSTAVDGDGDGKRDPWTSVDDALASAANLLAKGGWVRGQDWAREVVVPEGFDFSLTEGPRQSPAQWAALGVRRADGLPWSAADQDAPAQLLAPSGAKGPLFLAFPNHFTIRKYNNSVAYALAVGLLADRFGGRGPLVTAWPNEAPLSLADRMTVQRALAALGFDPGKPDGVIGLGTRTALRNWQKARGLVADGYVTPDVIQRLKSEAGAA